MSLAQPMHFLEKRTTLFPGLIPKVNFHGTLVSLLECNEGRYEKRVVCPLRLPPSVLHHLSSSFLHSATLPGVIYMKDDLSPDPNKHNACSMHRKKITSATLFIVASFLLIPLFLSSSLGSHLSLTPGDSNVWMNRYLSVPLFPTISKHLKNAMTVKGIRLSELGEGSAFPYL